MKVTHHSPPHVSHAARAHASPLGGVHNAPQVPAQGAAPAAAASAPGGNLAIPPEMIAAATGQAPPQPQ